MGQFSRGGAQRPCEPSAPFSVAQVLQQMPGPTGPMLHLSQAFASRESQEKLGQFIRQFICS